MNANLLRGALLCAIVGSSAAIGQPVGQSPLSPPANGPRRADPSWHVLSNATVHVKPGQVLEHGTVLIRNGRIEAVLAPSGTTKGEDGKETPKPADGPPGARVWDCAGLHIYPGFIDPFVEVDAPAPDANQPGVHWNSRVTPQRSALDGTGVDDATATSLRRLGFTAAGISPRGGIFRGKGAVVSLAKPESELSADRPPVYSRNAYHVVAFDGGGRGGFGPRPVQTGETPAQRQTPAIGLWSGYPDSQMGVIALIRQTLIDQEWQEQARKAGATLAFNSLDALSPDWARNAPDNTVAVVKIGDQGGMAPMPLLFDVSDELEALRAAKIAREFKRPAVLVGSGTEFERLQAIKEDGLPIILPLAFPRTPDVGTIGKAEAVDLRELMAWEQAPTNPRRLEAAGVKVSLTTAKLRNRTEFTENLSKAMKHGLASEAALAMVTTRPAELLGVSALVGTVEKGKVASLVVAEGDLFDPWPKPAAAGPADAGGETPKPETDAGPGFDDESDGLRAGLQPQGGRGRRGGFGDAGGAGAAFGSATRGVKIRDVWIDGVRHEINTAPGLKLVGTWEVKLDPGPEGAKLTVDERNTVTVWLGEKSVRARDFRLTENRLTFLVDDDALGLAGISMVSGVVEGEQMHGTGIDNAGKPFTWTATRTSKEAPRPDAGRAGEFRRRARPPEGEGAPQAEQAAMPEGGGAPEAAPEGGEPRPERAARAGRGDGPATPRKTPEQEEKEAIAAIPDMLPLPFGAYGFEKLPAQTTVVFTNVTIWTSGPQGLIEGGWMIVSEGKIVGVGGGKPAVLNQGDMPVVDLQGKHIAPGIIDCHSHTGISRGVNEGGQAVTAEVRIEDVTDPDSISWYRQLAGGTTTMNNLHGSANAIGGQNCVNKARWGAARPDDLHVEGAIPGIKFALGENPRQVNGGGGGRGDTAARYPATRMGVETLIRDRFTAAREYAAAMKGDLTPVSGDHGDSVVRIATKPRRDLELEALAEILEGKRLVHCHSYRQDEILMLCRVADDFHFKIGTFQHVLEGYKVADEIARHAIGGSCFSDWWAYKAEVQDAIPQGGPIMAEQGVVVSFNSDSDELARRLNVEAGKAVKYGGLSPSEALKFITINPAKQLMIDKRVGSLEPGKDADFAIWSGPPMSSLSRCEATYVDGRRLFSLEDDAKAREKIAAERTRLIQKVLVVSKSGRGGAGGAGGTGTGPAGTEARPTDDEAFTRDLMDLFNRGYDPQWARPGECGVDR